MGPMSHLKLNSLKTIKIRFMALLPISWEKGFQESKIDTYCYINHVGKAEKVDIQLDLGALSGLIMNQELPHLLLPHFLCSGGQETGESHSKYFQSYPILVKHRRSNPRNPLI